MAKGPKGEKRKADVIGNAVLVMRIATGEIDDARPAEKKSRAGKAGGSARAKSLSESERKAIAQKAAATRWKTRK